jgi:flavodoxin
MKTKILIIFSSSSGNTELVCDFVAEMLRKNGVLVHIQRAELSSPKDIQKYDVCLLACGTYDHGVLQEHFVPFARALKQEDFSGMAFAVIGLGDSKYDVEYNVESAEILKNTVLKIGGTLLLPPLKINKSPVPQLSKKVSDWTQTLLKVLPKSS